MPTCLVIPPNIFLNRCTRRIDSASPATAEPIGADQALGEAAGNGVKGLGEVFHRDAGCDAGVPEACAVEVHFELVLAGLGGNAFDLRERPDRAAAPVVRVLDREQPGMGEVVRILPHHGRDIGNIEEASRVGDGADHAPGKRGRAAGLVVDDVRTFGADDLVARFGVSADGSLIGHRARGHKARGRLAQVRRELLFKFAHGRVIAQDFIADLSIGDHLAHFGRRACNRVGTEIDEVHGRMVRARSPGAAMGAGRWGGAMVGVVAGPTVQ